MYIFIIISLNASEAPSPADAGLQPAKGVFLREPFAKGVCVRRLSLRFQQEMGEFVWFVVVVATKGARVLPPREHCNVALLLHSL